MSYEKHGFKATCLSFVAVLGWLALTATGARADWLVKGEKLETEETVAVTRPAAFILTVEAKKMEIQCAEFGSSTLKLIPGTNAKGEIVVSACTTFSPIGSNSVNGKCKPVEPVSLSVKAKLILHPVEKGKNYILFEPAAGGSLTLIKLSEECTLTETSNLTGSFVAECGSLSGETFAADCSAEEVSRLLRVNEALFSEDKTKFGANTAKLSILAQVKLSGKFIGQKWAGHI